MKAATVPSAHTQGRQAGLYRVSLGSQSPWGGEGGLGAPNLAPFS